MSKLKDAIEIIPGLFQLMDDPVWDGKYESLNMDIELLTNYGLRTTSPLVDYFADDDGKVNDEQLQQLSTLIHMKFKDNWSRLFEVLEVEYDLLDTYDVMESETVTREITGNEERSEDKTGLVNRTKTADGTQDLIRSGEDTNTRTGTDTTESGSTVISSEDTGTNNTSTTDESRSDKLSFDDRKDIETRDISRTINADGTTTDNTSDTLSFLNRENTQTRNLTGSEDGSTTERGTVTENTSSDGNQSDYSYGVGSGTNGSISNRRMNDTEAENTTTTSNTTTTDNSTTEGGTITDSKSGSEKTQRSGSIITNEETTDTDTGTVSSGKSGTETNTITGDTTVTDVGSSNSTGNITDESDSMTTYNTTDSRTTSGTDSTTSTNNATEKDDTTENVTGTVDTLQDENQERTLTRKGNTSGRTASDILQEHVNFWKFNFVDVVIKDVAKMLTIDIYS